MSLQNSVEKRAGGKLALYQELSKSGIVALVLISVLGGYLIGQPSELRFRWERLTVTLLGVLLLASGSSALNQLQEHRIDAEMPRTARRPLPSGRISRQEAIVFIGIALTSGCALLGYLSLTLLGLGVLAVVSYNGLYTLWWKKHWAYAAVPGAIPGALPILMGYLAPGNRIASPGGVYLFFLLFFWQMPHFWVLALKFREDYEKGGIPTLPVARGSQVTVYQITLWGLGYAALAMIAPLFLKLGGIYLVIAFLTSGKVLFELYRFGRRPPRDSQDKSWLKFFLWVNFSLILYIAGAALDLWSIYLQPV